MRTGYPRVLNGLQRSDPSQLQSLGTCVQEDKNEPRRAAGPGPLVYRSAQFATLLDEHTKPEACEHEEVRLGFGHDVAG
jgi:hypothetical protein